MNTNNNENGNSEIPEVEDLVIEEDDDVETIKVKVEEHNAKVKEFKTKKDEANAQLYARTKKAEGFELVDGKWVKPDGNTKKKSTDTKTSESSLTADDVYTLIQAGVPKEDIKEVQKYAALEGISIAEALAAPIVKTILAEKAETRKVAEGTNTGTAKRGNGRLSDDTLIQNANKGELPESEEDIARLNNLRWGTK